MSYLSRSYYDGDGATKDFTVGFPYLDKAHVKIYLDGELTTAWTWLNASTIRLTVAPAEGVVILVRRATSPEARVVDYVSPSSLNEDDLDNDSLQAFYLAQEANDQANAGIADDPVTGQFTANGKRVTNVSDPVDDQDAATKNWVLASVVSPVATAITKAAEAAASAVAAAASAVAAAASATLAGNKATEAAGSATTAGGHVTTALGHATAAAGSATSASTSAGTASTKATEASASATAAAGSAGTAAGHVTTAQNAATTATTKANAADASAVAAAASAASAAASAGSLTPVPDQINVAPDQAFTDDDMLVARDGTTGGLIKRSWANLRAQLAATAANFLAGTVELFLTVAKVWAAAVPVNLGNALSGSVVLDFAAFINAYGTLTGNITISGVSNPKPGQSGVITWHNPSGYTMSINTAVGKTHNGAGIAIGTGECKLSYYCDRDGKTFFALAGKAVA